MRRGKIYTALDAFRDAVVAERANFVTREEDLQLRRILAHIKQARIELDTLAEIDWQERIAYERDMGEDL